MTVSYTHLEAYAIQIDASIDAHSEVVALLAHLRMQGQYTCTHQQLSLIHIFAATSALLSGRKDVVVVSSVSCLAVLR